MTERNPVVVLLLTFVTCTLYGYWWLFATSGELRRESGRDEPNPWLDLILAVLTAGLWGLYATWRNSRIVHEVLTARGQDHGDQSLPVLLFNLSTFVWGAGWMVSLVLLQVDYNRLARRSVLPVSATALPAL